MLCKYAEANAFNTSRAHDEFSKFEKAAGPIWGGAAGGRPHYVIR